MDWQRVKSAICEGRRFALTDGGCRVLSDTLMPSGGLIYVHFQSRIDDLSAHDNGAAFDELSRHGGSIPNLAGLRRMLAETRFRVTDDGIIWRDHIAFDKAASAITMIADASHRAASFLVDHAIIKAGVPLNQRVKEALHHRFPQGRSNFAFEGKHRQHTFDYGFAVDDRTYLVQSVNPDPQSVSSAIVKGLDARQAEQSNVVPIFAYDPADKWPSGSLGMLDLGGFGMTVDALKRSTLPIAA
jgi:hypothetical protein